METLNILDIILALVLVWALVSGLRKGIISQASSFLGLLFGVWLAFEFNDKLSEWIGFNVEGIAAYAILFAVGVAVATLSSRLSSWILKGIGLGLVDKIGGAVLSIVVYSLVLNLLLGVFRNVNNSLQIVDPKVITESKLVQPIEKVAGVIFPYLEEAKGALLEKNPFGNKAEESDTNQNEAI